MKTSCGPKVGVRSDFCNLHLNCYKFPFLFWASFCRLNGSKYLECILGKIKIIHTLFGLPTKLTSLSFLKSSYLWLYKVFVLRVICMINCQFKQRKISL